MAKPPVKLSGLLSQQKVVPQAGVEALDLPPPRTKSTLGSLNVEAKPSAASPAPAAQPEAASAPTESVQAAPESETKKHSVTSSNFEGAGEFVEAMIDLDLIDPNPYAPREIYTPEMLAKRASEIDTQGQHDAIHVVRNPDSPGRYVIADGWTRVQATRAHLKDRKALRARIHDVSVKEAGWLGYQQNEGRDQQCDFDRALFFEKMQQAGHTNDEIATKVGLSKSQMSMFMCFTELPEEVLGLIRLHAHKFSYRVAHELRRINRHAGVRKTVSVATEFAETDQTVRWLINQATAVLNPATHKVAPTSKHIRYANGGYLKQKQDGFELSLKVPADKRDQFAQRLEELIRSVAVEDGTIESDLTPPPGQTGDATPPGGGSGS